jgi:4-amino-4-deoxy-L-arabinose transferase-like glycosyltransferase
VWRLLILLVPTSVLVPLILFFNRKRLGHPDSSDRLLLFAGATLFAVFTVAGHYRPHYMLPLMPLTALLLAAPIDRVAADRMPAKVWQGLFWSGAAALAIYPVLLIGKQQYATGLLLAGAGVLLVVLLQAELREPVWRGHPLSAQLLTFGLMTTLIFAGFNAFSYRGNRAGDRDFSLSVGRMLRTGDELVTLCSNYPHVLPYYARHIVVSVDGVDELKRRVARKGAGEVYLLVQQEGLAALNQVCATSTLLAVGSNKKPEEKIVFAKILGMCR